MKGVNDPMYSAVNGHKVIQTSIFTLVFVLHINLNRQTTLFSVRFTVPPLPLPALTCACGFFQVLLDGTAYDGGGFIIVPSEVLLNNNHDFQLPFCDLRSQATA